MALQTKDVTYDEKAEEILLETEWSTLCLLFRSFHLLTVAFIGRAATYLLIANL